MMKKTIACSLVVADFVSLALASKLIWSLRDQGYASPSRGDIALRHFVGAFPFGPALVLFGIVLLAALLIYPWPRRMLDLGAPEHSPPELGVWPPPPVNPDAVLPKKPAHPWSRPDTD